MVKGLNCVFLSYSILSYPILSLSLSYPQILIPILAQISLGHHNETLQSGWLTQQTFNSHGSRNWEIQVHVLFDSVLGEDSSCLGDRHLPAVSTQGLFLGTYMWRESKFWCVSSSRKDRNPMWGLQLT